MDIYQIRSLSVKEKHQNIQKNVPYDTMGYAKKSNKKGLSTVSE